MAALEPDEPISSIAIEVYTAGVSDASTDSDIFVELFDWPEGPLPPPPGMPFRVEIDTDDYNDFEGGQRKKYHLPSWYFGGRIVNDIVRLRLHKGDDWGTDWGLGWVRLIVNGKDLYLSPNIASNPDKPTWLSDGDVWSAPGFKRVLFVAPKIQSAGLPDAGSDENYEKVFKATGGRKPLTWKISAPSGNAFTGAPTLKTKNADGTEAAFKAHTVKTNTTASWKGVVTVTDAEGRHSNADVSMRVIFALPPPTVKGISPAFGWPALKPAEPTPVVVTINSGGNNFDSRKAGATEISFPKAGGGLVKAKVLDITSALARVEVPQGAVTGPITVKTGFGKVTSNDKFTVHPNGYRFISGFSFTNRAEDDDATDGFPNTFAWERFEQTFGLDEMWIVVFDQAVVPNPISTFFYITTHDSIGAGCCHGFCLTSLQMKLGIIPTGAFSSDNREYPLDDCLWELTGPSRPSGGLSKWIQTRQLVMFSDEALSYFLNKLDDVDHVDGSPCTMDARPALADISLAIASGLSNPRMIAFAKNCSPFAGHVVVPYQVEQAGNARHIRVYDPNKPAVQTQADDEKSVFRVNPVTGDWGYTWGDGAVWDGVYMFSIPMTEYGHQTDWSVPGFGALMALGGLFLVGCAATDPAGDIRQVTDGAGKVLFDMNGETVRDRSQWPAGVRPMPQFSPGRPGRKMLALTKPEPLSFRVRPRAVTGSAAVEPALFSIILGPDISLTVEEVTAELEVRVNPAGLAVEVAPVQGKASAILRYTRRFSRDAESVSFAMRTGEIAAGKPVRLAASKDGRGAVAKAPDKDLMMDIEVTHTSRIGEVRILECDEINVPRGHFAEFSVSNFEDLDKPDRLPLAMDLDPDGSGGKVTRQLLGQRLKGLTIVTPPRVIVRPPISIQGPNPTVPSVKVPLVVAGSTTAFPTLPMRYRIRGERAVTEEAGKLLVSLPPGSRPLRIVAEDTAGHRSFPRTVVATVPEENQRPIPFRTLFGEDVTIQPGEDAAVPLGAWVMDLPATGVVVDFSIRDRLSGMGNTLPRLITDGFELSPALTAAGAQVKSTVSGGGLSLRLEIRWKTSQPLSGRITLGHLRVKMPPELTLGSTFVLRGSGSALLIADGKEAQSPLNVLPALLRIWGGVEPGSLTIDGPAAVAENAEIKVRAVGQGVSAGNHNAGWWVEKISGRVSVRQNATDGTEAGVKGVRAGLVRLKVVVGTQTAEKIIRITPAGRQSLLGLSGHVRRNLQFPSISIGS